MASPATDIMNIIKLLPMSCFSKFRLSLFSKFWLIRGTSFTTSFKIGGFYRGFYSSRQWRLRLIRHARSKLTRYARGKTVTEHTDKMAAFELYPRRFSVIKSMSWKTQYVTIVTSLQLGRVCPISCYLIHIDLDPPVVARRKNSIS
jgi:hypothetical protein